MEFIKKNGFNMVSSFEIYSCYWIIINSYIFRY